MELLSIKVADAKQSATNVKGRTEGKTFDELVASVKEKGILSPILVREMTKGKYEVIAGNRRLAAARVANLKEIPAQLVEMNDTEAHEAQIIENLQREDIHPLDEADAFFSLVKTSDDFKVLAAKLGKSESYVRNRIMLCNLVDVLRKAYLDGKLNDGQALEISKLSPEGDQEKALNHVKQSYSYKGMNILSVGDLKEWIDETFFNELAFQPWLKDKEAMKAIGECKYCPKETSTLFGEIKTGACTSMKCYRRKMDLYIKWLREKTPGLVLVSANGWSKKRGVIGEYDYKKVKKEDKNAKPALIVEGRNRGAIINITSNKPSLETPEEKKDRLENEREEKDADKKRRQAEAERESKKMAGHLDNITWPMKEKHLEPLFDIVLDNTNEAMEVANRLKLDGKRNEDGDLWYPEKDLRDYFLKADAKTKLQIIFELGLRDLYDDLQAKVIKKL